MRVVRNPRADFRYLGEGLLEATEEASTPRAGLAKLTSGVRRTLIGAPLHSSQAVHERLTKVKALAVEVGGYDALKELVEALSS